MTNESVVQAMQPDQEDDKRKKQCAALVLQVMGITLLEGRGVKTSDFSYPRGIGNTSINTKQLATLVEKGVDQEELVNFGFLRLGHRTMVLVDNCEAAVRGHPQQGSERAMR